MNEVEGDEDQYSIAIERIGLLEVFRGDDGDAPPGFLAYVELEEYLG